MILVRVDVWPGGDGNRQRVIGTMTLENVSPPGQEVADYAVQFGTYPSDHGLAVVTETGVRGHRRADGAWVLVRRALEAVEAALLEEAHEVDDNELPDPECRLGYTAGQVDAIVGEPGTPNREAFDDWMRGQTVALCDGTSFDHEAGGYVPSECSPDSHGVIVYVGDLARFRRGGGWVD